MPEFNSFTISNNTLWWRARRLCCVMTSSDCWVEPVYISKPQNWLENCRTYVSALWKLSRFEKRSTSMTGGWRLLCTWKVPNTRLRRFRGVVAGLTGCWGQCDSLQAKHFGPFHDWLKSRSLVEVSPLEAQFPGLCSEGVCFQCKGGTCSWMKDPSI